MLVEVTDVFLRDGLQDEHVVVATKEKLRIAAGLKQAGVQRMEVASFVNPKKVPQMADAAELFVSQPENSGTWTGLALNARGVARALEANVDEIQVVASASNAHSAASAGNDTDHMLAEINSAIAAADVPASEKFFAGISTAFTCPFEGDIPAERVINLIQRFGRTGITSFGLADTLGTTPPEKVIDTVLQVKAAIPEATLSLHLHNAHGQALDTVAAAIEHGVVRFDAALAGFGGCPFAPGAAGNLDTLELVRHIHALSHHTGIDEQALEVLSTQARESVRTASALPV